MRQGDRRERRVKAPLCRQLWCFCRLSYCGTPQSGHLCFSFSPPHSSCYRISLLLFSSLVFLRMSINQTKKPIFVGFEGQILEHHTRRPGQRTAQDIFDIYEDEFSVPLELWNGDTKITDPWKGVGRCKKLMLKRIVQPLTSTPAKETPPHHQVYRPGKTVEDAPFLRPTCLETGRQEREEGAYNFTLTLSPSLSLVRVVRSAVPVSLHSIADGLQLLLWRPHPTAGETQYTALYQFPCFTSDFQRAGQLVQPIFTLEWSRSQSGGEEDTDSESVVISDRGGTKTFPELLQHVHECIKLLESVYMIPVGGVNHEMNSVQEVRL